MSRDAAVAAEGRPFRGPESGPQPGPARRSSANALVCRLDRPRRRATTGDPGGNPARAPGARPSCCRGFGSCDSGGVPERAELVHGVRPDPTHSPPVKRSDRSQIATAGVVVLAIGLIGGLGAVAVGIAGLQVLAWLAGRQLQRRAEPIFHNRALFVLGWAVMVAPLALTFLLAETFPTRRGLLHPNSFARAVMALAIVGGIAWWQWRRASGTLRGTRSERRAAEQFDTALCHWCGMALDPEADRCSFCGRDPSSTARP